MKVVGHHILVGDYSFCKLANMDEKQRESEDPPHVVSREMKPCVMMDLNLRALTAPTNKEDGERDEEQEDMWNQVESINEAAIVEHAIVHTVGIYRLFVATKSQGHSTRFPHATPTISNIPHEHSWDLEIKKSRNIDTK